jgi:rRNA maturation endonuclease Nob1
MKIVHEPRTMDHGLIEPAHVIEAYCAACGYDLDEAELEADACADCGQALELKQHVSIHVTTVPAASGGTLR